MSPISRINTCLLLTICCAAPALSKKDKNADPPEVALGERLFLETRFAQFFHAFLGAGHGVNDPLDPGDPVMDTTAATGTPALPGPFAGTSMNCRQCHLVGGRPAKRRVQLRVRPGHQGAFGRPP